MTTEPGIGGVRKFDGPKMLREVRRAMAKAAGGPGSVVSAAAMLDVLITLCGEILAQASDGELELMLQDFDEKLSIAIALHRTPQRNPQ
jgi:hypothetical protein